MMRHLVATLLAMTMLLTPLAMAQESEPAKDENPERPDDAAWVDDCPPDMMCAADAPEKEPGDNATYDGNCGGEVCAYDAPSEERPYGSDDCIECSQAPVNDTGSTCMDGQQDNETCRDDVQYMDGPSRGPADGACENCRGDTSDDGGASPISAPAPGSEGDAGITSVDDASEKPVPAAAVALGIVALAGAAVLVAGKRRH